MQELQQSGRDPNKHDFKPEWIEFWNRRMRELHEQEFMKKKEELREKLGLPVDDPKPHFNRRKKFIRDADGVLIEGPGGPGSVASRGRSRSPSPWEDGMTPGGGFGRDRDYPPYRQPRDWRGDRERDRERSPPRAITVLRMLTALEQQLGSLGPRVNGVLSEAIALEKMHNGNSDTLLRDQQVVVLFETVKEKFKGLLLAGIVERNMVMATRNAIGALTELLYRAPTLLESLPRAPSPARPKMEAVPVPVVAPPVPTAASAARLPTPAPAPQPDPVTVPGIGAVDKAAIAREIATALIAQGKTNVTEAELEQLVTAVVGMAQAQAGSQQTVTAAQFLSSMQAAGQAASAPATVPAAAPAPAPVQAAVVAPEAPVQAKPSVVAASQVGLIGCLYLAKLFLISIVLFLVSITNRFLFRFRTFCFRQRLR